MIIDGKTKTLTKLDQDAMQRMWGGTESPYNHLLNIETKNRLTANDAAIDSVANVAACKTNQTCDIFRFLEEKSIPTTFISQKDSFNFVARECEMIPYECVIRRIAYGSFLKRNMQAKQGEIFDDLLFEFFYKLAAVPIDNKIEIMDESKARELFLRDGEWTQTVYTDPYIEFDSTNGFNIMLYNAKSQPTNDNSLITIPAVITVEEKNVILNLMEKVFTAIENAWKKFDVTLVDMKIEFGRDKNSGALLVADVIDNDSWRIWPGGDPKQQLDKQSFRDGENLDEVTKKYNIVSEYTRKFYSP